MGRQEPYVRTHPLTRDRLRDVKGRAASLTVRGAAEQTSTEYWFQRAKGKLSAFVRNPSWTLRNVRANDQSDIAIMRRAVAHHRKPDARAARIEIDALTAKRPDDPFVHELRGQILLESRDIAGGVTAYGQAAELAPSNALILAGYGRALLAAGRPEALDVLRRARDRDPRDPRLLRDLAQAYARKGETGQATLATAERYALLGRMDDAGIHAQRATGLLPRGSPGWRRADDILAASKRSK
jgi:predicted Zn-dependent protease